MFVIEVENGTQKGWIKETPKGFYFVHSKASATIFSSYLDAEIAVCYIEDRYYPTVVKLMECLT